MREADVALVHSRDGKPIEQHDETCTVGFRQVSAIHFKVRCGGGFDASLARLMGATRGFKRERTTQGNAPRPGLADLDI